MAIKRDCGSLITADSHIATSLECYPNKQTTPKQLLTFSCQESNTLPGRVGTSHRPSLMCISCSQHLYFLLVFLSSVASQMQAERIDCKENPIQAFNKGLFMLDRVVALSAA